VPRLIGIAASESAALKISIWPTNLHVVVVGLPIFVRPLENESADANLIVPRSTDVRLQRIPLRVKKCRDRLSGEVGVTRSHLTFRHIIEVDDGLYNVLPVPIRGWPAGVRRAPLAENQRLVRTA